MGTFARTEAVMNTDYALSQRLRFLDIDESVRQRLRALKPILARELPLILSDFYDKIRATPDVRRFFSDDRHMDSAKGGQVRHWATIAEADYDERYVESVRRIGQTHARIGLEPRWYIGGYTAILESLVQRLVEADGRKGFGLPWQKSKSTLAADIGALVKAVMLDMDFAISVYLDASEEAKRKAVHELAERFELSISGVVHTVAHSATELEATAMSMANSASEASERSSDVAAAAEEATANVSIVAASADGNGQVRGRDRPPGESFQRHRRSGGAQSGIHEHHHRAIGSLGGKDQRSGQSDFRYRRPDQPPGAQCDHRKRARWRGGPRLCCGGVRSEGARHPDRQGH